MDLTLNPERYTGYKGRSAHRIWHSIYKENCFRTENSYGAYIQSSKLEGNAKDKFTLKPYEIYKVDYVKKNFFIKIKTLFIY